MLQKMDFKYYLEKLKELKGKLKDFNDFEATKYFLNFNREPFEPGDKLIQKIF